MHTIPPPPFPLLRRLARRATIALSALLAVWLASSTAWAETAGTKDLGRTCSNNAECRSGFCDAGWGTSKTNKCIPGPARGVDGDYCSNNNQCKTGKCAGLRPSSSGGWIAGKCTGKRDLGNSCGHNSECKSGYCDAGWGTSKTNKCIPGPAKGGTGDYCSNDNQCSSANCKGLRPSSSGGWIAGKCAGKQGARPVVQRPRPLRLGGLRRGLGHVQDRQVRARGRQGQEG